MHDHIADEKLSQEITSLEPFYSPQTHSLNVGVAMATKSANAALIFSHIFFWIEINKKKEVNQINGRTWMYETVAMIASHFPYLSEQQVKDNISLLVEHGYLIKGNYSKNKFDRTNWYALANEDWVDIKKMFSKRSMEPKQDVPEPDGSCPPTSSYKDKDKKTDVKKEDISDLSVALSIFFLDKFKSINPKIKPPVSNKWAKDFELMIQKDGHTEEEIKKAIEYVISTKEHPASNGFSWAKIILSPDSLRKHFARIWGELQSIHEDSLATQRAIAEQIQEKFSSRMDINHSTTYIEFINGVTSEIVKFGDKKFKERVMRELKKRNLQL